MKTLRPHLFWDILRRSLEEDRMLFLLYKAHEDAMKQQSIQFHQ